MKVDNLVLEDQGLAAYSIFNSEAIWRLEMERIFSKAWLYLAHESEIPNPGDYVLREMANNPVIVVRGNDGKIRAFANFACIEVFCCVEAKPGTPSNLSVHITAGPLTLKVSLWLQRIVKTSTKAKWILRNGDSCP